MRILWTLIILLFLGGTVMAQETVKVKMVTSKGDIMLELYPDKAPITVENFKKYANDGFYTGTIFHRVIKGFMIQGGGMIVGGHQKKTTYPEIKLESKNGLKNDKFTIAMARTSVPDSASSQFFINTVDNDFLNAAPGNDGYAVFGKVTAGDDVVKAIEAVATGAQDVPTETVMIKSVTIEK